MSKRHHAWIAGCALALLLAACGGAPDTRAEAVDLVQDALRDARDDDKVRGFLADAESAERAMERIRHDAQYISQPTPGFGGGGGYADRLASGTARMVVQMKLGQQRGRRARALAKADKRMLTVVRAGLSDAEREAVRRLLPEFFDDKRDPSWVVAFVKRGAPDA